MVTGCSSITSTLKARKRGPRQPVLIGNYQEQSFPRKPQQTSVYICVRLSHIAIHSCREVWERQQVANCSGCSCWASPVKCFPSLRTIADTLSNNQPSSPASLTLGRSQPFKYKLFPSRTLFLLVVSARKTSSHLFFPPPFVNITY